MEDVLAVNVAEDAAGCAADEMFDVTILDAFFFPITDTRYRSGGTIV